MGSGLILFVIVGAWLAVLVPMFLRSHDAATSHRSADRFSGAMRVLAHRSSSRDVPRRHPAGEVLVPRRAGGSVAFTPPEPVLQVARGELLCDWLAERRDDTRDLLVRLVGALGELLVRLRVQVRRGSVDLTAWLADGSRSLWVRLRHVSSALGSRLRRGGGCVPPAVRRRRTLYALLVLALLTLAGSLLGPVLLLGAHQVCDLVLVAFLVQLRRQAMRRAARARPSLPPSPAARPFVSRTLAPLRVAGIPDRMPARPASYAVALLAPEQRDDNVLPQPAHRRDAGVDSALGSGTWEPIPVPVPTYVGKNPAPQPPKRVVDLTRPGQWSAEHQADTELDLLSSDDSMDGRRAVNDW